MSKKDQLLSACRSGSVPDVLNLLDHKSFLSFGALDINTRNSNGSTPLIQAVFSGSKELVELLVKRGADVNIRDSLGWNALMAAVADRKYEIARFLAQAGGTINIQDSSGETPLTYAVSRGSEDMVDLLLKKGASKNVKDGRGKSPIELALLNGKWDIARRLAESSDMSVSLFIPSGADPSYNTLPDNFFDLAEGQMNLRGKLKTYIVSYGINIEEYPTGAEIDLNAFFASKSRTKAWRVFHGKNSHNLNYYLFEELPEKTSHIEMRDFLEGLQKNSR